MSRTRRTSHRFMPLMVLCVIFFGAVSSVALAGDMGIPSNPNAPQTTSTASGSSPASDPCADGSVDKRIQSDFGNIGDMKAKAAVAALNSVGSIDLEAMYCVEKIMNGVKAISKVLGAAKLNLFDSMADMIIGMIEDQVIAVLGQLCQQVLGQMMSFINASLSILNKICIPLPDLNLDVGSLGASGMKITPPCKGLSPISVPKITPSMVTPNDFRSFGK